MRITPDPFGSSSTPKRNTPSSSTSLNTLAKASPQPQRIISSSIKAAATKPKAAHKIQSHLHSSNLTEIETQNVLAADNTKRNVKSKDTATAEVVIEPYTISAIEESVSIPPISIKPLEGTAVTNSNDNLNNNNNLPSLMVDTLQKPLWRSQSSHALFSPNQLQGIVVESLKTPTTNSSHSVAFEPNSPDQKGIPWMLYRQRSQSTSAISSSSSSAMRSGAGAMMAASGAAAANMISSAFGGHVQSASGSQERHDYLHQQQLVSARSIETPLGSTFGIDALYDQSFSTFSAAVAPLVKKDTEVVKMDGVAVERGVLEEPHEPSYESNTYTAHRHRQSTNSSRPVLLSSTSVSTMSTEITVPQTTSAGNGGSWSDDDEQASSVSTDTEVELESGVEDQTGSLHVHRPTRRMNSTRTGGKSHYSAYRRRIQSISQLQQLQFEQQQQQQKQEEKQDHQQHHPQEQEKDAHNTNFNTNNESISSILAVSTASLATAKQNVQAMDGTNSMQFFNRHLQHVVQQNHGVSGGGSHNGRRPAGCAMDASSPSIFSNATLSPASCTTTTSIHSALTTTSFASSASGFTAITGTTSSSVYALSSSDPSETSISRRTTADSATSTLCGVTSATTCNNGKAALHAKGARRFIRWIHPDIINQRTDSKTPPPPSQPRLQRNGKKGPKRPDAKAFFSNERTYMHWIKFGLLLGSMALTLVSFGKSMGLQVGLFLVLVAMSTLVYATTIFHLRDRWMKQFRLDVLYYDRLGPSVLFIALFLAFATNVALTVLKLMDEDGSDNDGLNFYNGHLDI